MASACSPPGSRWAPAPPCWCPSTRCGSWMCVAVAGGCIGRLAVQASLQAAAAGSLPALSPACAVQGLIPACRDAKRRADRTTSESDAARQRVLGHNRTAHFSELSARLKRETPERLQEKALGAREDLLRCEAGACRARLLATQRRRRGSAEARCARRRWQRRPGWTWPSA